MRIDFQESFSKNSQYLSCCLSSKNGTIIFKKRRFYKLLQDEWNPLIQMIGKVMLIPGAFWLYVVASIALYHLHNRDVGLRILYVTFLGMAVNAYLKSIFQIPLLPHLGEGWSLPSGHTQAGVIFWVWIAIEFRHKIKPFWCAIPIVILSAGIFLNHFHEIIDIVAAYVSGACVVLSFYQLNKLMKQNNVYLGLVCLIITLVLLLLYPKPSGHFGIITSGLTVITLSSILFEQKKMDLRMLPMKLCFLCFSLLILTLAYILLIPKPINFDGHFIFTSIMGSTFFILLPRLFDSKACSKKG